MRMKNKRSWLGMALFLLLTACGHVAKKADVESRDSKVSRLSKQTQSAPVPPKDAGYIVKKGDTLYRVALETGQAYRDLVLWNNLANPNDIKVGQVLQVAPPEAVGISIHSGSVEMRPLGDATVSKTDVKKQGAPTLGETSHAAESANVEKQSLPNNNKIEWVRPTESDVVTPFDPKKKGVDFSGKLGQSVYAAADGMVMYAGSGIRGYGNLVIIKHAHNFLSAYAHNQKILVKEKQRITRGQKIAEMGNSDADRVKLHFEIREQGKPVDPMTFLPGRI